MHIQTLQSLLKKQKIPALLITKSENVFYLSGFRGSNGSLLITPKKYQLITDARYFYTAKKLGLEYFDQSKGLDKLFKKYKAIHFESADMTVTQLKKFKKHSLGSKWKPSEGLVESLRLINHDDEISLIKKACKIALKTLEAFQKTIKEGQSEDDMEWNLLSTARQMGADGFSFPPIITFGKETADIHHQKGKNKLKAGQQMLLDFGIVYKGYITDMTRMFYTKKPSKKLEEIHRIVVEASQKAIESIEIGKKLSDIDAVARNHIKQAGYGDYFLHSTGHGTGVEVHEQPWVASKSKEKVQTNMVFTIEPGIYIEGLGGVRIEDMVWVKPNGKVEVLTEWNRNIVC